MLILLVLFVIWGYAHGAAWAAYLGGDSDASVGIFGTALGLVLLGWLAWCEWKDRR